MMRSSILVGALGGILAAVATREPPAAPVPARQDSPPRQEAGPPKADAKKESVVVPFFGNEKCPVEGNAVDRDRFLDHDGQRVYACSVTCMETLRLDPSKAFEQAYPEVTPVVTKGCGACTADLDPTRSVAATFQGRSVHLCGPRCEKEFRRHPGVWLARITYPDVKDVGNVRCPISDEPIDGVAVVIWKSSLVRLSAHRCVAGFEKDPDAALEKARTGN